MREIILMRILAILAYLACWVLAASAWVTHVVVCIKSSAWVLLAFGCLAAPVGVLHGWGIWLGVF